MSNIEEKTKPERAYEVKGIPVHAYLIENGEFQWIPTFQACGNKDNAQRVLEVLKKMTENRRAVWASRLDKEQAKMTCPVIRKDADLCKQFDDFCTTNSRSKSKKAEKKKGGEIPNE